jgi:SAM-dependent methyltransferase
MASKHKSKPSLENLVESVDLGIEILHPGGLEITGELAELCHIGKDTTVLDVASGTGESDYYIAEKFGSRVTGVDASESMIERARKKAVGRKSRVEFIKGDAHNLPFDDGVFDMVISECTLCLLDKERAIREMVRVAKTGGCVGFHDIAWKERTPKHLKERLAKLEGERPETLAGWKSLFEKAGLVDVRVIDKSYLIPGWMKGTRKELGLSGLLRVALRAIKNWGLGGLVRILGTERIFQSRYMGYAIVVGRKA